MRNSDTATRTDFYVYMLFREDGRTPFYIGKGRSTRWCVHEKKRKGGNAHLSAVVNKVIDALGHVPKIKVASDLTEKVAFSLESLLIRAYGRHPNGPLVNYTDGGDGLSGMKRTEQFKQLISERMRGDHHPMYGRKHTDQSREKMRASSYMLGRKLSVEECEQRRIRAIGNKANSGRTFTPEHRAKISAAHTGKRLSIETRARISATRREKYAEEKTS